MQQISTAQSPKEGSSEETAYYRYKLNKFEDTLDNLIKSFDDDEEVQGNAQDIKSLMELLVAGEQVEMVGSETLADECTSGAAPAIPHHPTLPDPHETQMRQLYHGSEFLDDVNRLEPLPKEEVIQARLTEMAFFRKMGVYAKVDRVEVKQRQGKIISTKWIDTNKGTKDSPNYRSRLVGREIKKDKIFRNDLYAAIPPLEVIKLLIAKCAMGQKSSRPLRIATVDVRQAYFYARAQTPIYVEIPAEDWKAGDEGKIARLEMSVSVSYTHLTLPTNLRV